MRRPNRHDARAELYRALEELPAMVDGLLLEQERQEVQERLVFAKKSNNPRYVALAKSLVDYLNAQQQSLAVAAPGITQKIRHTFIAWGQKLGQKQHRRIILWLVGLSGVQTLFEIILLSLIALSPNLLIQPLGQQLVNSNELRTIDDLPWFLIRVGLQLAIGLITLVAFIQIRRGREENGVNIAIFGQVLSLTTVVLLNFYLDQFQAISSALLQFALLLFFTAYRQWYLGIAE